MSFSTKTILVLQAVFVCLFLFRVFDPRRHLPGIYFFALIILILLPNASYSRLNPDSYLYYALGTAYLTHPGQILTVDAFTVGPVVPGIVALLRAMLGQRTLDDPVRISQFLQLSFFACIATVMWLAWISIRRPTRGRPGSIGAILAACSVLLVLACTPWSHTDFRSYNGEAVAIVIAAMLCALAFKRPSLVSALTRAGLAVLTAYVKSQALPLVGLLLLMRNRKVQIKGHRINERVLVALASASIFALWEVCIVALDGQPFVSKVPALVNYVYSDPARTTATIEPKEFAAFASDVAVGDLPLRTLPWALTAVTKWTPAIVLSLAVFAVLTLRSGQRKARWRAYLVPASLYCAVAILCIAIPGNIFDHYTLLVLPVSVVLARGFASCGRGMFPSSVARFVGFALVAVLAGIGLLRTTLAFEFRKPPASDGAQADIAHEVPRDLILVLRQNMTSGDDLFVHGWNYAVYAYTGSYPPGFGLDRIMYSKQRTRQDFIDYAWKVKALEPTFIVDLVSAQRGLIQAPELALSRSRTFARVVMKDYQLMGTYEGIPVYRRKASSVASPGPDVGIEGGKHTSASPDAK